MTLGKKLTGCILLIVIITVSITVVFSYYNYADTMDNHYKNLVRDIGLTAASQLDGDKIEGYLNTYTTEGGKSVDELPAFEPDEYYYNMYDVLSAICTNMKVKYLYLVYNRGSYSRIILDTENARDSLGFGEDYRVENAPEFAQYTDNMSIEATISKTEEGWFCSGYEVVNNSEGKPVAMVGVDIMMDDVMADRQSFLSVLIMWMVVATLVLIVIFVWFVRSQVVRPINQLSDAAAQFVSDKENEKSGGSAGESAITKLNIHTHDEIENLSTSVKTMEKDINAYIANLAYVTAEKERIGAELSVANHIQANMLPSIFPPFPDRSEFDIYASMTPAKEVGGDFYDFFLIDDNHLALVMADVSGKGVPAALFMVIAKTLLKNSAQTGMSPKAVLEKVNNQLCENNDAEMFVTVWMGIIEISTGKMVCANAGHEYPTIKHADGKFELYKDRHGFVLAGMENAKYREYELELHPGDWLFVYTDGVAEATDAHNELFGTDRMLASLNSEGNDSCPKLLHKLKEDIDAFVGEAPQFDDITMLALKLNNFGDENEIHVNPSLDEAETIGKVTEFIEGKLESADVPMKIMAQLNIAVDEIMSNICRYSEANRATVSCRVEDNLITMVFIDNGAAYNPLNAPEPDTTLSAEDRKIGGLGIFMVKKSMDSVVYEYQNGSNTLTLKKTINKQI